MAGRFNFRAEWKLILDRGIGRLIYFKIQFIKHQINRQIKKDLSICITHQARSARQQWGEGGNSSQTWNAQRWRTTYLNFGKLGTSRNSRNSRNFSDPKDSQTSWDSCYDLSPSNSMALYSVLLYHAQGSRLERIFKVLISCKLKLLDTAPELR